MQRSKLAEVYSAKFASVPLIAECVLLNPAFLDRRREREVCDLLLVLRDQALVIQMKSGDKPRTGEKLTRWVEKEATKAASHTACSKPIPSRPGLFCAPRSPGQSIRPTKFGIFRTMSLSSTDAASTGSVPGTGAGAEQVA